MHRVHKFILPLTIALLITGNLVGAGILGLPVNTGIDGFILSLVGMLLFGSAMYYYTALVLGKVTIAEECGIIVLSPKAENVKKNINQ